MELIANVLLAAGAFGTAIYCFVLSRRLARFTQLESGIGSAIAVLSAQVDDLTQVLAAAQTSATRSAERLETLTGRAEAAAAKVELLLASMHDLPEPEDDYDARNGEKRMRFVRRRSSRGAEAAE